jgi:Cys-rich protein (TIGR01571 family)
MSAFTYFIAFVAPILLGVVGDDECSLIQTAIQKEDVQQSPVEQGNVLTEVKSTLVSMLQNSNGKATVLAEVKSAFESMLQFSNGTDSGNGTSSSPASSSDSSNSSDSSGSAHKGIVIFGIHLVNPLRLFARLSKGVEKAKVVEYVKEYILSEIVGWITIIIVACLFYLCCFNASPKSLPFTEEPAITMTRHHFACCDTPRICCCSFFCPILQWSETMSLAGYLRMAVAIVMFAIAAIISDMTLTGWLFYGAFTSLLVIVYRQRIRERFGLPRWTAGNCLVDFLYVCCCSCCAIAQEAQAVRYAIQRDMDSGSKFQNRPATAYVSRDVGSRYATPSSQMLSQGSGGGRVSPPTSQAYVPYSTASLGPSSRPGTGPQTFTPSSTHRPPYGSTGRL